MIQSYSTKHSSIATLLIEFIDIEAKTPSYYSVQSQLSISTPLVALNNCTWLHAYSGPFLQHMV